MDKKIIEVPVSYVTNVVVMEYKVTINPDLVPLVYIIVGFLIFLIFAGLFFGYLEGYILPTKKLRD